jgi:uncharacterized membrane protein
VTARRNRRRAAQRPLAPQQQATVQALQVQQTSFTGPLPPPDVLREYNAIVPGMAERLLVNLEKQSNHRMALEKHVLYWDVRRANAGLAAGLLFGLAVLVAAVFLILNGHESVGVGAIIGDFLVYGGAFVYGDVSRRRERNQKLRG